jgi:predicted phosphodiesterase
MQPLLSRDLGAFDAPVLIFGGPYGNLQATEALFAAARAHDIPPARVICTGDVVAYCADPLASVRRIRDWGCAVVMGNCEEALASDGEDCGCGFAEGSACATLSKQWFALCARDLDHASRIWMGSLPRRLTFTLAHRRLAVVHGAPSRINGWVFASTPTAVKTAELAMVDADGIVAGHCGMPFTQVVAGKLWHNAGTIGMPADDGTARVWYSILTPSAGGIIVTHHALAYDHRMAMARMRERGYPEGYALALERGLWPSCDVLPPAERARRGRALRPDSVVWSAEPALA